MKQDYLKAKVLVEQIDAKLRSTDKRLGGSVLVIHQDGSLMLWDRAFVLLWKGFALILTEHHGPHVYLMEDLRHLRALGPRLGIKTLKGARA
jgi:hypothetical protein